MLPSHSEDLTEDLTEVSKTEDILQTAYYQLIERVRTLNVWLYYLYHRDPYNKEIEHEISKYLDEITIIS